MSLLSEAMELFVIMDKRTEPDGYGGYIPVWSEGAEFQAAVVLDTSIEAKVAEAQGVTALYTVTTTKAMNLQYHDIIKRVSDGKVLRITSDGDDKKTPRSAGLNMRQVSAEQFDLSDI